MFDIKPVSRAAGRLDLEKKQIANNQNFEAAGRDAIENAQFKKRTRTYILGVGIESDKAPIFHDPRFNFNNSDILTKKDRELAEETEKMLILQKEMQKERDAYVFAQKEKDRLRKEELVRSEAFKRKQELERIAQKKLRYRLAQEAEIKAERERITREKIIQEKTKQEYLRCEKIRQEQIRQEQIRQEQIRQFRFHQEEKLKIKKENKENEEIIKNEKAKPFFAPEQNSGTVFDDKINAENCFSWKDLMFPEKFLLQFNARKTLLAFAAVLAIVPLFFGGISYTSKGLSLKGKVLGVSQDGLSNLSLAIDDMTRQDFESSTRQFSKALANFTEASDQLDEMGDLLLDATRFVPFASKISSGKNAVEAGKHFSAAGQSISEVAKVLVELKNSADNSERENVSFLDVFRSVEKNVIDAKKELDEAQLNIDKISVDDLPEEQRDKFLLLKQKMPEIRSMLDLFLNNSHIFADLLGGNGPRKYLFLFQNNAEMRATGGFIGSYGLLDIANGSVKKFFIDGIFNPDGQLKEKIVPPVPIQKISAAWSLHDSNWFPDFPVSAQKAIYFYEKTGGPTADGVITFTPTMMHKLLEITGPIEMPDYGVTLDADNFTELTQYEVEVDYDKEENRPKKILSDLAPLLLEKILANKDFSNISKALNVFLSGLQEKHILLYSQNKDLEEIISKQGWAGEVVQTPKDYISVINTNINGFKTDSVIEENIEHIAEIQADGSVVDTVTITRKHNGGNLQYEWFNKVNADYMRVYVPQGSRLLEVNGQTREANKETLDYDSLGFKRDAEVQNEESNMNIDQASGTRVYDEAGKTVFANWTYVSPQETTTITYKYVLPFSLFKISVEQGQQFDSYSLVAQKQSGSAGSSFVSKILYPSNYELNWNTPESMEKNSNTLKNETNLTVDRFEAAMFKKNQ